MVVRAATVLGGLAGRSRLQFDVSIEPVVLGKRLFVGSAVTAVCGQLIPEPVASLALYSDGRLG